MLNDVSKDVCRVEVTVNMVNAFWTSYHYQGFLIKGIQICIKGLMTIHEY